jgi:protein TonB
MLPVSVAAHAAALAALLIIPLAAEGDLPIPGPPSKHVRFVAAAAMPRPVPPARPATTFTPVSKGAPTQAPDGIRKEVPVEPEGPVVDGALPLGVGDGLGPASVGVAVDGPVPPSPPPPLPPPRKEIYRIGGDIRPPRRLVHVAPVYPEIALRARVEGTVILEAIINERGVVTDVRVLRSQPLLDEAALQAVRHWRYTPTLLNGAPVPVIMTITCHFSLDEVRR